MKKMAIALVVLGLLVATTAFAANPVRISQIYGGSGNYYKCDYVELFNSSSAPVNIGGWSLQYGSSTGSSFGSSTYNYVFIPDGSVIPACGYFLIRGYCGSAGADLPIVADLVTTNVAPPGAFNCSGTSGKFALFNDQVTNRTPAQVMAVPTPSFVVDLVGYGPSANAYETSPAPVLDNNSVLVRGMGGLTDNDNNSTDFTKIALPYAMHNSGSALNPDCQIVPAMSETWGRVKTLYR